MAWVIGAANDGEIKRMELAGWRVDQDKNVAEFVDLDDDDTDKAVAVYVDCNVPELLDMSAADPATLQTVRGKAQTLRFEIGRMKFKEFRDETREKKQELRNLYDALEAFLA